jgi:RNase P subunit RPR2
MTCSRCKGLMVEDYSLEVELLEDDQQILAWRCVNCGHIIEPVMLRNRLASLTNQASLLGSSRGVLTSF